MPKIDIVNAKNIIESNPEKAFFKLKNTGGPKGDTGAQGPKGDKGDQGEPGAPGASASVTVGSTTTLSPGADATVTNSGDTRNAILNFGIPTGAQGPQGIQGPKGDTGPMGQTGAKGDTGAAATVQVGNTNTGAPGTNAQVTNAGNEHFAVFNFTIPRGDKGETGATGAQGAKGDKGDKGDTGTAATITVGSTTTTNPGTNATVTNSGTTSAAVLNFGIPRGATGSVKSEVVAELPETGEEDTFYLVNREATEQTATGKAINFTNSDNSGDITDFQLDGETSQNGTPTPDAPVAVNTTTGENVVEICGKNLYPFSDTAWSGSSTSAGWVFQDGAEGAFGGDITSRTAYKLTLPAGTYTATAYNISSNVVHIQACANGSPNEIVITNPSNINRGNPTSTITLTETTTFCLRFRVMNPSLGIGNTKIQIEKGSTATAYEPYQEQSYEVNLGKNLINFDSFQQSWDGASVEGEGTTITMSPNTSGSMGLLYDSTTYSVSIPAGKTITWSRTWGGGGTWESGTFAFPLKLTYSDGTTETLSFGDTTESNYNQVISASKTLAKSVVSVKIESGGCFGITNLTAPTSFNLQLELGSQATSYAAYFEPIELCKIGDYQDYIYKSDGKWYVHKAVDKIVLDGTEGNYTTRTNTSTTHSKFRITDGVLSGNIAGPMAIVCDYFIANTGANTPDYSQNAICGSTAAGYQRQLWFSIANTIANTVDAFKSWVASNTPSVYYALATPTDTEITNQALITQLDNVASAPLYTGVNNITTITPNEQGTLEIKYVTYDKYNQNKVYIWNDTLQQWQIIVP